MTLDYQKVILQKVSFNVELFEKELKKTILRMINHDLKQLHEWCMNTFSEVLKPVIDRCFGNEKPRLLTN